MSRYLAITGGVGGAKLALGLAHVLPPDRVCFLVNTGDDFEHLGLHVSPDLDTLMYTLSGLANPETGWGRDGETWNFVDTLGELGGESWFRLGDRDLAVHVRRTGLLREGMRLTDVTARLFEALRIAHRALPMSDEPVRTTIDSDRGRLDFQHYFVRERCEPVVHGITFEGAERARPVPELEAWVSAPDFAGTIVCPSNPWLSVDPILAVQGMRELLGERGAPVVAVSPIVGGEAIKGPTAKIMAELELPLDAASVARHYAGLLRGYILDETDAALTGAIESQGLAVTTAQSVMRSLDDRIDLAHTALEFLSAC